MKLISKMHSAEAAHELASFLENASIAVLVVDATTGIRRDTYYSHLVYVVVDAQYEDAVQLIRNPQHVVTHPVDVEAYKAYMASPRGAEAARSAIGKGLLWMLLVLICLSALVVWKG